MIFEPRPNSFGRMDWRIVILENTSTFGKARSHHWKNLNVKSNDNILRVFIEYFFTSLGACGTCQGSASVPHSLKMFLWPSSWKNMKCDTHFDMVPNRSQTGHFPRGMWNLPRVGQCSRWSHNIYVAIVSKNHEVWYPYWYGFEHLSDWPFFRNRFHENDHISANSQRISIARPVLERESTPVYGKNISFNTGMSLSKWQAGKKFPKF